MKKNLWIWALVAATFMTACSKDNDPVQEEKQQQVTEDDFESPDGRVVIQLGGGDYLPNANATVTRAPLDNTEFIKGNTIVGIYAASTTGAWTTENLLLNNRKAKVTGDKRSEENGADTSKETAGDPDNGIPAVTAPYKISLFDIGGTTEGQVEYYPMMSTKNFTFYGYAPYATGTPTASGANVTFENFNGSQDIIWGQGVAAPVDGTNIWVKSDYSTGTGTLTGYNAKYIRMLKYHYELNKVADTHGQTAKADKHPWVPNIAFGHKLVQLKFYVIPATEQSKDDKGKAEHLYISNIRLQNHGKPTLAVGTGDLTFTNTDALSMLGVTGGTTFTDIVKEGSMNPKADVLVGYLLVKPGQTTYDLQLDISPFNRTGTDPNYTYTENTAQKQKNVPVTITLDGTKTFEAGCSYNIKLGIYAMQEVEADASLTEWKNKGDVDIDVE